MLPLRRHSFRNKKHRGRAAENQFVLALKTSCILFLPLCSLLTACGPAPDKRVSELEAELRLATAGGEIFQSEIERLNRTCDTLKRQVAGSETASEAMLEKEASHQGQLKKLQAEITLQNEKLDVLFDKIARLDLQTGVTHFENRGLEGQLISVHNRAQDLADYVANTFPVQHSKHWKFLLDDPSVRRSYRHR